MKSFLSVGGSQIIRIVGGRSACYLIKSESKNILVDSSVSFVRSKILKRLEKLQVNNLDFLILTHSHFDHTANAAFFQKHFNVKVLIHAYETGFLAEGVTVSPAGTNFITRPLMRFLQKKRISRINYEPCVANEIIEDNTIPFLECNIKIIHTPGHSCGSVCIIVDDDIAIVGDTLFGIFPFSAFPPFADDTNLLIKSWQMLLTTECRLYLPSHGRSISRNLLENNFKRKKKKTCAP
jgi:glyoxylase-like metal-dependent hydrolase (beta-lactamase superfamily II)